jgi:hypothetical protein
MRLFYEISLRVQHSLLGLRRLTKRSIHMRTLLMVFAVGLAVIATGVQAKDKDKEKNKGKSLPPGLEKKVASGGELPPGWQKKYRKGDILDRDIYRHGKVIKSRDRDGLISIQVDGTVVRLVEDTREIISILSR